MCVIPKSNSRHIYKTAIDPTHRLRNCLSAPSGGYGNGDSCTVSGSYADLVEAKDSAINAHANGLKSLAND